ncbi:MAG TPA: formate/nitrite transporter family protein [Gaiellaceae bacterium]|nr:formate/nitrite transporter family protein [Gaiellaceae bacterium]
MTTSSAPADAPAFPAGGVDALPPAAMARRAEEVGVAKAGLPAGKLLALAVLAGAFIAMGAVFATTVTAGSGELAFGVTRLLAGLAFSLGLVLVVVAGAELFTGNNLVVMAWAGRRVATTRLLWTWLLVYVGNFAGAVATAALVYAGRQYELGGGAVGEQALAIGVAKTSLGFGQAIALGALCNALVCVAVWLTYSARTTADRILAVVPPIAAFVAAGFEHSVANMYFVPFALFVESDAGRLAGAGGALDTSGLTWSAFLLDNLVPVTIGNVLGGTLMVGAVYWFVYLRRADPQGALR